MKKRIFSLLLFVGVLTAANAQSEKYVKAMQDKVAAIDTLRNPQMLLDLSAAFERIADAEKTQWQPYYYASLAQVSAAFSRGNGNLKPEIADPVADKAEALLSKAEALAKDNSEIFVLKKMIANLRMLADPMNRYMTYGAQGAQALQTAKTLNPENPRTFLLEAEDKYFTPEQFGGSKEEARRLFEAALKKYDAFKPATPLDPIWGRPTAQYFLSQLK
ncbi:hypothetical protein [Flavisolibacter nicotianae]|uniref:hypothetical protein n=1 Tax=Flavisolibacter nicotianae TaxID=2364882 RepID=UPI000EB17E6F|nr:hypothetical protein [Flavisolibacter nicotianae]